MSTEDIHNLTSQCVSKVFDEKQQEYWQRLMKLGATEAGKAVTASPKTIKDPDPDYKPEPEHESDSDEDEKVKYKKHRKHRK